jgi:hypothetical protein
MKKYKKDLNLKEKKVNIKYMASCYKKSVARLLSNNYDSRLCNADVQSTYDLEYVVYINEVLESCKKQNRHFLDAVYFETNDEKQYYSSLSRSTLYRIQRNALLDFFDCLKDRLMIKSE